MSNIKKDTISGIKWGMLQRMTLQPLQLVYGMVLARLISPAEMGIVGLTLIFFAIAGQLSSAGFGTALIRKLDRTEADMSTMFWFNMVMSLLMGLLLFFLAPWFASFYQQPELLWLTRVSAVLMFLNSSASVHWTLYKCRRDFKTPAIVQFIAAVAGMPVCLVLAWMGWGVWALMWQSVFVTLLTLAIVWRVSPWKPRFLFSWKSFKELFAFGGKVAYSGILHVIYQNLRTFIIGKFYSPAQLGLYSRGAHVVNMLPNTIDSVMSGIVYPILATIQDDDEKLKHTYSMYVRTSTLVIAWVCMCLQAMAEPTIMLLYGETWLGCAVFIKIAAWGVAVDHINAININLLLVKGRSDLMFGLEVVKKTISVLMLLYAATISVEAICWASVIYIYIAICINGYFTGKQINMSFRKQHWDYIPYVVLAALTNVPAWFCTQTGWHILVQLLVGGSSAFVLYFGYLHLRRDAGYMELYKLLRGNRFFKWLPSV